MLQTLRQPARLQTGQALRGCGSLLGRLNAYTLKKGEQARHSSTRSVIEHSLVEIELTNKPKPKPDPSTLKFGKQFTDHMLTIPWNTEGGWGTPRIHPFGPVALEPNATVFHFAHCLHEGMKAFRHSDGKISMFRPDMNMKRMNATAERGTLPTFNSEAVIELIKRLVNMERDWVPDLPGHSLYIRPFIIGSTPTLQVVPPDDALLMVICCPVGPYYPNGFKPISLYGTTEYVRAAPGGIGAYKLGANYAAGVRAFKTAKKLGYDQNLWLFGPEPLVKEVGTSNAFAVFEHPKGVIELATPPLDGMVLPGITRDSILTLAREHASGKFRIPDMPEKLKVSERPISMEEVKKAAFAGTLLEFFGTGTAAVISPVNRIGYVGEEVPIPTGPDGMGPVTRPLWRRLVDIQTGVITHPWSVAVA